MNEPKENALIQLGLPGNMTRRQAMQWVMAAVAVTALPSTNRGQPATVRDALRPMPGPTGTGYGLDAKLVAIHHPGDLWPLTFTDSQRKTAAALADVIIPNDQYGPAASEVGVVAMLDEWISAPYPQQKDDRPVILDGLKWLEDESKKRFARTFGDLMDADKHAICNDICHPESAKNEFHSAARFFARFRSLCAGAYYATPAGWKAIGYVGNVPLASFDGPPAEVLEKLGVTQTVK